MSVKDTGHMQTLENSGKKTLAERIAGLSPEQRAVYELKRRELQKKAASPLIPSGSISGRTVGGTRASSPVIARRSARSSNE